MSRYARGGATPPFVYLGEGTGIPDTLADLGAGLPLVLHRLSGAEWSLVEAVIGLTAAADVAERVALGVVAPGAGLWSISVAVRAEVERINRVVDALRPARDEVKRRLV